MSKTLKLELPFKFRDWQAECAKKETRFTVLALHRRAGKTTYAVMKLISASLQRKGLYCYVAPQLKQARLIAWSMIKEAIKDFIKIKVNNNKNFVDIHETEPYIEFYNGSQIILLGADDPDKLRGVKLSGAVIDEVAQMPREAWTEVLYPALLDCKGWALFIGTPKGINLFSELYSRGFNEKFKPDWSSQKFTCYETHALSLDDIEKYKRDSSENEFEREMMCSFDASAEDQVITLKDVNASMSRKASDRFNNIAQPMIMGVDVARYGDDNSVIVLRKGEVHVDTIKFHSLSLYQLAIKCKEIHRANRVDYVLVDGTGVGGGLVDILMQTGLFVYDVNFSARANSPSYKNKRTEMWFKMAKWIEYGCLLDDEELKKELASPTYISDENGKKAIESKKDIKKRLGYSPDTADALALTFAEDFDFLSNRKILDDSFDFDLNNNNNKDYIDKFDDEKVRYI